MQEIGGRGLTITFVYVHNIYMYARYGWVWFNWPLFRGRYASALVNTGKACVRY